ncbi:hypothetical protein SDC9_188723 [bioreactor metagenome]|uniref:Uncharacterized protein n=1 Tax=bioreactor metagenome TaxID=1076179 RepID=A0A645HQ43_9ZZZZ
MGGDLVEQVLDTGAQTLADVDARCIQPHGQRLAIGFDAGGHGVDNGLPQFELGTEIVRHHRHIARGACCHLAQAGGVIPPGGKGLQRRIEQALATTGVATARAAGGTAGFSGGWGGRLGHGGMAAGRGKGDGAAVVSRGPGRLNATPART